MKQPVTVLISDVGQPRRDADNLIQLTVASPDTKMPFIKIQVQRHELAKLMNPKWVGHLDQQQIEGFIVT
jgi:hypothetical protein